jgi:hypothetical protein
MRNVNQKKENSKEKEKGKQTTQTKNETKKSGQISFCIYKREEI